MRTLIRNARIFDGSGEPLRLGSVLVEGERIAAVALGENAITNTPQTR